MPRSVDDLFPSSITVGNRGILRDELRVVGTTTAIDIRDLTAF